MVAKAVSQDDRRIAYIAPTYQQARDIAWQDLKRIAEPIAVGINESRLEVTVKTQDGGASKIVLRGWEAVETLRGQRFDFLVIDEIASMRNWWINWDEVLRPTLTDTMGEGLFISTPKGFNHFYDLFNRESRDEDFKSFHFTSYDNPFLPYEELNKAKTEITEDRFAQEYMADFRKQEGLVYKEFKRSVHLFDPATTPITRVELMAGIDFGFTNPCAVVHIVKDQDANYWVLDEYYRRGQTDDMIAEYVGAQGFNKVYPDPENPSAIASMRKKGVPIREVIKNKDSVKKGIDRVRDLFTTNRLHISKHCENLILELETYAYPEKKDLKNEDENPIKENDHALDALRYAVYMQPESGKIRAKQYIPRGLARNHFELPQ